MSDYFCGWSPSMLQTCSRLKFQCGVYIWRQMVLGTTFYFIAWQQSEDSRVNVAMTTMTWLQLFKHT